MSYKFPTWWGGEATSDAAPQIVAKLRDLRLAVGGLAAKKQQNGPLFPVRSARDLAAKLAQALCNLEMHAPVVHQEISLIDTDKIPGNTTNSGKPVFRTLAHVKSTVRICAPDGSYIEVVGSGHGGDVDDKAGGKATTYAWKDAILKGLTTPEQDMIDTDDSSSEETRPERPEKPKKSAPATSATSGATEESPHAASIKALEGAPTLAELEAQAAELKGKLTGADRLRATQAYVTRKQALQKAAT